MKELTAEEKLEISTRLMSSTNYNLHKASLNRPAWTSESKTGMFHAYRHLHIGRKDQPIIMEHFIKSKGML